MDTIAFEAALKPLLPPAYRYALHLTGKQEDAADLLQEASVAAFRGKETFTPGTNFRAWLFRIITNAFYQRARKKQPVTIGLEDAPESYFFHELAQAGQYTVTDDPASAVLGKLESARIRQVLDELPEENRIACALYFINGMSYQEIADVLGIPIGTVRSRLHRGRRMLQFRLWDIAKEHGYVRGEAHA